jgi:hypothetical protein
MTASTNATSEVVKIRVGKLAANIVGNLLAVLLCAAAIVLAHKLPHYSRHITLHRVLASLGYFAALVPVHESLHAIGLMTFGKVPWRDIRFGVVWRALMPYCHCTVPITIRAYRRMALTPLVVMGLGTLGWLLLSPDDLVALLTGLTLAVCVGDVWMVLKMRGFNDPLLVRDSPSEIGCDIFPPAAADQ